MIIVSLFSVLLFEYYLLIKAKQQYNLCSSFTQKLEYFAKKLRKYNSCHLVSNKVASSIVMSSLQSKDCQNNDPKAQSNAKGSFDDPLDDLTFVYTGYFNGFNVELRTIEDMELYNVGWFGKGSASRSKPVAHREFPIMRKRQFQKRNEWYRKFSDVCNAPDLFIQAVDKLTTKIMNEKRKNKVVDLVSSDGSSDDEQNYKTVYVPSEIATGSVAIVVPNSESELEDNNTNYFDKLKAECCVNHTELQEKLMLSLQEAFFLVYGYGCLQIIDLNNYKLNIEQTWNLFNEADKKFVTKYVVYHYFRSKGYIVKPGIKFGGDYLLYRCGPELAHSDYVVVIRYENDETDWISTLGHVRMANTTSKEILIAEVVNPKVPGDMPEGLKNYCVRSTVLSRNIGSINEDN